MLYRVSILVAGLLAFGALAALRVVGLDDVYHRVLLFWGVDTGFTPYIPFVDFHEILAALQCHRLGFDVFVDNHCDVMGRAYAYPPLWLLAAPSGLGPEDTTWMGTIWVLAFLCAVAWISNPRGLGETAIYLVALASPACLLAMERANIDIIMFLLIAAACSVFCRGEAARVFAYGAVLLAALLKFYPIAAMALALNEKKLRLIAITAATCLAFAALFYFDWHQLSEMWLNIPRPGPYFEGFGSLNLFEVLQDGLTARYPNHADLMGHLAHLLYFATVANSVFLSSILYRRARAAGISVGAPTKETSLFLAGAFIIVFAFFAGKNFPYRGVWLLTLLPLLLHARRHTSHRVFGRLLLPIAIAVIITLLWFEFLRFNLYFSDAAAVPFLLVFLREPLWWMLATGLMTALWLQLSSTPFIGRMPIFLISKAARIGRGQKQDLPDAEP